MPLQATAHVSATDDPPEKFDAHTPGAPLVVEQIIRPTGLLDPKITIKPLKNQIDETIELCRQRVEKGERILVTTLTKRTAEDLADYLRDVGLKVRYLHSDIDAIERVEILRGLRAAEFDILVGINLLREGLESTRGFAGVHSGRGQGAILAQPDFAHPDSRPRCAPYQR